MLLNISRSFTSFRLVRQIFCLVWLVLIFAVFDFSACAQEPRVPGPRSDGSVILPNQWLLRPVGKQVEVGDFPINIAIHPEGSFAAVLHCGYGPHEIVILDLTRRAVVSRTRLEEAFYGLSFDASGKTLFASGSGAELIHRYRFENGTLIPSSPLPLRDAMQRGIPAGIATTSDGSVLFAANLWAQSVSRVNLKEDNPENVSQSFCSLENRCRCLPFFHRQRMILRSQNVLVSFLKRRSPTCPILMPASLMNQEIVSTFHSGRRRRWR